MSCFCPKESDANLSLKTVRQLIQRPSIDPAEFLVHLQTELSQHVCHFIYIIFTYSSTSYSCGTQRPFIVHFIFVQLARFILFQRILLSRQTFQLQFMNYLL